MNDKKIEDFLLFTSKHKVSIMLDEREGLDLENLTFHVSDNNLVLDNSCLIVSGSYEFPKKIFFSSISSENLMKIKTMPFIDIGVVTNESELKNAFRIPNNNHEKEAYENR